LDSADYAWLAADLSGVAKFNVVLRDATVRSELLRTGEVMSEKKLQSDG
jgi:hypothetical protein